MPNESIESVKCAVGSVTGSFDKAMGELTKYRRKIRRRNKDNQRLAVIFNDYMNCLWGDPTAEKEFPLWTLRQKQAVNISALTQAGMLTAFGGTRSANGKRAESVSLTA